MASNVLLITGGAGFIGQNAVHWFHDCGRYPSIVVLDALTYAANPTSLEPLIAGGHVKFVHGDITDLGLLSALFEEFQFDCVAHLAAETHVDRSIVGPDAFLQTNVNGTYNLLKCALNAWQKVGTLTTSRFLHVSTDEVFGDLGPDDPPFTETTPYRPSSPYSATKASADHLVSAFVRTYGLPAVITNCSNNYGPYQHPEKLIPLMIIHVLEGRALPVYGNGRNVRDWLYVEDHCRALELALSNGTPGQSYNIGGGSEQSNIAVVGIICDLVDAAFRHDATLAARYPASPAAAGASCRTLITFVKDRPGHDRRYAIDPSFAKRALGYVPQETFASGLERTVAWYIANDAWWRRALTGDFAAWVAKNYGKRDALEPA